MNTDHACHWGDPVAGSPRQEPSKLGLGLFSNVFSHRGANQPELCSIAFACCARIWCASFCLRLNMWLLRVWPLSVCFPQHASAHDGAASCSDLQQRPAVTASDVPPVAPSPVLRTPLARLVSHPLDDVDGVDSLASELSFATAAGGPVAAGGPAGRAGAGAAADACKSRAAETSQPQRSAWQPPPVIDVNADDVAGPNQQSA